ncbi:hypothetical protein GCM10010469_15130 [Streptomyces labedae]|uniref:Uncharacterized protein n=1 Tax=Streptomyces labedae TaxID=285569 RepID=A0ABP6QTT4_9ACTN
MLLTAAQAGEKGKRRGIDIGQESVETGLDQAVRADVPSECPSPCQLPQPVEALVSRHAGCTPFRPR